LTGSPCLADRGVTGATVVEAEGRGEIVVSGSAGPLHRPENNWT